MYTRNGSIAAALGLSLLVGCLRLPASAGNLLNLLPTPKVLKIEGGEMPLTAESRIVAMDPGLAPLAAILSDEILLVTTLRLTVVADDPKAGDIVLKVNPKLQADADILTVHGQEVLKTREYAHTLAVTDRIVIEGWDYRAVCEGTATLLQAIVRQGDKATVPRMTVKDWPYSDFGAIMIDCARQHLPIRVLKMGVETCRLFKIRYLHLHLTDDNAYTFPSTAYPEANSRCGIRAYTLDELKDLVAYADVRGITCVPEIDGPGHCTSLLDGMKGKLGDVGNRTMDVLNPEIYPVLDTLVREICEVFKTTPYFHIGGDEVEPAWYKGNPHVKKYIEENNIKTDQELWLPYARNMAQIVKKHGKKAVMWDGLPVGCPLDPSLANDIIVYTWFPRSGRAREAQDAGFTTITVPWNMPPFPEFSMFTCNGDVLTRTDKVLGHCRPMWEMDQIALANGYLRGSPERQERTWAPDSVIEEGYHKNRMAKQNARADRIIRPVTFRYDGRIEEGRFSEPITVSMSAIVPGSEIRYRLDGEEPTLESALYEKPFKAAESLRIQAALFDRDGKRLGNLSVSEAYHYVDREQNLTTGKPVTTSHPCQREDKPELAVDGEVRLDRYWACGETPSWLQIDLQKVCALDRVHLFPFWDGTRYYQYTVELSTDGNAWKKVVDASGSTEPEKEKGKLHTFDPMQARYVRVNMLKNSDNYAVHLVEVRVFEAGK